MNQLTADEIEKFRTLTYTDKLKFWGEHDFYRRESIGTLENYITINPSNKAERILYNQWIINYWRDNYINGIYEGDQDYESIVGSIYSFDELKEKFSQAVNQSNLFKVTQKELADTEKKLNKLTRTNRKKLLKRITEKFEMNKREDLLTCAPTMRNKYIELRYIARIWDLVEYKLFLHKQLANTAQISELDFYVLKQLSMENCMKLHEKLVAKGFIECSFDLFEQVFRLKPRVDNQKILWRDYADKSTSINKQTLFTFIINLTGEIPASGLLYKFLQEAFKTNEIVEDIDVPMKKENLKKSYHTYRKSESQSPREKVLIEIINQSKKNRVT